MSFSLQFNALKGQLFINIEGVLRSTNLRCCRQMLEVSFQPRLFTRVWGGGWSRLKVDVLKAKLSGWVKNKARTSPFVLVCCSLSHLSQPLAYHDLSVWAGGAESTHPAAGQGWPGAPRCCDTPGDAAEPLVGRLCHWWSWRNSGHSLPPFCGLKQVSPCRRIHFTCFLICWSNRVRSVGKAEITFKFPDSLRRLLSVYDVVTAPRLMCLFYSHSSECTEQGCTTATTTKVYTRRYLADKPTAKITGCRYVEICETRLVMFVWNRLILSS